MNGRFDMNKFGPIIRVLAVVAAFAIPAAAAAQVAPPAVTPPPVQAAAGTTAATTVTEYVLGPEDVVEIEVVGTSDKARARVYTDGTIQTALGGRVAASGKTPRELAAELGRVLKASGIYSEPVLNVEVVSYASRYVTVLGAVSTPGLVPINRPYRLSEILARVGGVRGEAAGHLIVRSENGQEKRYAVDSLASGDASQDPFVTAGDKIFSPEAEIFYVSGQVTSPGSFALRPGMTVAQAIAKAGGVTESGNAKSVSAIRGGKKAKLKQDALVEPGDVLTIGERLF
jgi:polysaccharide export outer membrane protein